MDHGEFVIDLVACLGRDSAAPALARAEFGEFPEFLRQRFTGSEGKVGKLVAEIAERELAALRDLERVVQCLGKIAETCRHLVGRTQVAFRIRKQQAPRGGERHFMPEATESVEQSFSLRACVTDVSGRHRRQVGCEK